MRRETLRSVALGSISSNLGAASMVRWLVAQIGFLIRLVYTDWDGELCIASPCANTLPDVFPEQVFIVHCTLRTKSTFEYLFVTN